MSDSKEILLQWIEKTITEIRALGPVLDALIEDFRKAIAKLQSEEGVPPAKGSGEFLRVVAFTDALIRLRMFLERNFNYLETLGVLAITRYVFELTVWLRLVKSDPRYGRVYCRMLFLNQLDHYRNLQNQRIREISFLRSIERQEKDLLRERVDYLNQMPDGEAKRQAAFRLSGEVREEIDRRAARAFSIYAEQARTNGYGFQADLVEHDELPRIALSIADLEKELYFTADVQGLLPKARDWNWSAQAKKPEVGMKDDYEFIYSYTSRLLHAMPGNLSTDEKDLELSETQMFIKYVHVRMLDMIDMARELPPITNTSS